MPSQKCSGEGERVYFVLLYPLLVDSQVFGRRLSLDLHDSLLGLRQPIGELLQLLLLEIHQDLVEPGGQR